MLATDLKYYDYSAQSLRHLKLMIATYFEKHLHLHEMMKISFHILK